MKTEKFLFILLAASWLLLEFAFYGITRSQNSVYLIVIITSTAAVTYISYILYDLASERKAGPRQDYYFYLNDNRNSRDNSLFFPYSTWKRK